MQDLSRVTGNPQSFKIRGEEINLEEASLKAFGRLQTEALKAKRRSLVEPVKQLQDLLSLEEYKQQFDDAVAEAKKVAYLTEAEFEAWSKSPDGIVSFVWIMADLQHPSKGFTRDEVEKAILDAGEDPAEIVNALGGVSEAGNETGPTLP
jgi:hypothetical protein